MLQIAEYACGTAFAAALSSRVQIAWF